MKNKQKSLGFRYFLITALSIVLAVSLAFLSIVVIKDYRLHYKPEDDGVVSQNNSSEIIDLSNKVISSATVVNTGDIIIHSTVYEGAKTEDGGYDFSAFFKESDKYFKNSDLAVANLEVTLAGPDIPYRGYPSFNSPDSLLDTIKNAGINFLLTANNHCYDTGVNGFKRTIAQLKTHGIDFNGTRENETDPIYTVKDVNGIKIGMINFTYENVSSGDNKSINGTVVSSEVKNLINSFSYEKLDQFYITAQTAIDGMKQNGADAVVFYMHWGEEYQLNQNNWQKTIAQKLCNMGVDIIIGGHPHVIQPIELIHSEDSQNTTVCIYSLGNAISNQRKEILTSDCSTGHTEDGIMFYYTFDKYGDGEVVLSSVDAIPAWVNKYKGGSGYQYTMYPLESIDMANNYGFDNATLSKAQASYERTKNQISEGLTECQNELGCNVRFAEQVKK